MQVITMYDSITPSEIRAITGSPEAIAGYVGGWWPDYSPLVAMFPRAKHKSVAVNALEDADILDIENGDAVPADAPAWFRRQKARGLELPGFYASASAMPEVIAVLTAAGIQRHEYVLWVAHYTYVQPTPPFEEGADAVQFTDKAAGRNVDQSVTTPAFWGNDPKPKPVKNPPHYDWFDNAPRWVFLKHRTERAQVELYDKLRAQQTRTKHPHRIQLWFVRKVLKWFANRVATVAIKDNPLSNGKPSWGIDHRGWRYQQLAHRAQGARLV